MVRIWYYCFFLFLWISLFSKLLLLLMVNLLCVFFWYRNSLMCLLMLLVCVVWILRSGKWLVMNFIRNFWCNMFCWSRNCLFLNVRWFIVCMLFGLIRYLVRVSVLYFWCWLWIWYRFCCNGLMMWSWCWFISSMLKKRRWKNLFLLWKYMKIRLYK